MGFTTIATVAATAAAVVPKIVEADAAFEQSKALRQAASEQARLAGKQADAIEATAAENQRRGSRNAHMEMGRERTDAAVSNTAREGSTYQRGVDLATRLQDEINASANEQLMRANSIREQGAYDAWDLRNQARQSKAQGIGAVASGVGSLFSGLASGLSGLGGSSRTMKEKS